MNLPNQILKLKTNGKIFPNNYFNIQNLEKVLKKII